jgi:hypothetical protein
VSQTHVTFNINGIQRSRQSAVAHAKTPALFTKSPSDFGRQKFPLVCWACCASSWNVLEQVFYTIRDRDVSKVRIPGDGDVHSVDFPVINHFQSYFSY